MLWSPPQVMVTYKNLILHNQLSFLNLSIFATYWSQNTIKGMTSGHKIKFYHRNHLNPNFNIFLEYHLKPKTAQLKIQFIDHS